LHISYHPKAFVKLAAAIFFERIKIKIGATAKAQVRPNYQNEIDKWQLI
jgi:hypothetical protein